MRVHIEHIFTFIHIHKVYLVLSHVSRVLDLCCDYSCRQNGALSQAAFALQKPGNGALLRVPDGIVCCMKENFTDFRRKNVP